ncbi:MAG: porin family protein [bacterium]|nr:porin family protein [bacterium]
MRRVTIMWAVCIVIAGSAFSQTPIQGVSGKGLKLGFGSSLMTTDYEELKELFEFKIGFHGGAFLTYDLSPSLSIQPELLFSVKGATSGGIFQLLNWSANYVEVPVLLKFNLSPISSLRPTIYAGPSFSYLMSAELDVIFVDPLDVTDYMKSTDLGIAIGSDLSVKSFTFEVRYTIGLGTVIEAAEKINALTEADPGDSYYFPEDPTVKHRFLSFMLGYKF